MSQVHKNNTCPNCGFETTRNYCAQCGQETHLHDDTFWGMVMHFIGHYFHYDSKFWQTLKALLFYPGKLTLAFWNKQRARYIPPISLYIFITAVFFLVVVINPHKLIIGHKGEIRFANQQRPSDDSLAKLVKAEDIKNHGKTPWHEYDPKRDTANFMHFIAVQGDKIDEKTDGNAGVYIAEQLYHTMPKVFFFLIPLMAAFLGLLFLKRKEVYFSNHTVFSLHIHSFIFIMLLLLYIPFIKNIPGLIPILICLAFVYTSMALHNAYSTTWLKAICYSLLLGSVYAIFFVIAVIVDLLAIFYFA